MPEQARSVTLTGGGPGDGSQWHVGPGVILLLYESHSGRQYIYELFQDIGIYRCETPAVGFDELRSAGDEARRIDQ